MRKIPYAALIITAFYSMNGWAAGYSTNLLSASALGNSYAGSVTGSHDVSDMFFNPAVTAGINKNQFILSASYIAINSDPDNEISTKQDNTTDASAPSTHDSAVDSTVPALYLAAPINDRSTFNFSITSPFGLVTKYDNAWSGRYKAIESSLKSINFNPSFSYKINNQISFGFGLQAQYSKKILSKAVEIYGSDYYGETHGSDWSYGYNFGALFEANKDWKFGIGYRSKMNVKLKGKSKVDGLLYSDAFAKTTSPESLTLGANFKAKDNLELVYDLTWTRWSRLKTFTVDAINPSFSDDTTNFNWHDSYLHSLGANYGFNDKLLIRSGVAYEKAAINNRNLEARVPNTDKIWLSAGFNYKISETLSIDSSYIHQFFKTGNLNLASNSSSGSFSAKIKTRSDVFSLAIKKEF